MHKDADNLKKLVIDYVLLSQVRELQLKSRSQTTETSSLLAEERKA